MTINLESSPRSLAATITKNAFFCRDTGSLVLAYIAIMALQLPTLIILSKSTQDWNDKCMANIEWSTSLIVTKQTHKLYIHYTQLCLHLVNSVSIYVGNQMLPVKWGKYLNYNIQDNTLLLQWGAKLAVNSSHTQLWARASSHAINIHVWPCGSRDHVCGLCAYVWIMWLCVWIMWPHCVYESCDHAVDHVTMCVDHMTLCGSCDHVCGSCDHAVDHVTMLWIMWPCV